MAEMKPSGIAWIGEIPSDWEIIRLKQYAYLKGRIGWQGLKAEEFVDEGPYLVTGTDFDEGRVCWERSYHISEERYDEAPQIQLRVGDLLVTKDGTIGKLAYIDNLPGKASLNSHLLVVRPLRGKFFNEFLYWVLASTVFQSYYELTSDGSTMDSLSQEKIGDLHFAIPPLPEQRAIATFLDDRCGQVDSILADLERQIEILRQYKKALITEAVTKGLDKSVPMKDSGIDWIGEMPKHWEIKRLKFLGTARNGLTYAPEDVVDEDKGVLVLRSSNIQNDVLAFEDNVYVKTKIPHELILQENDLLICSRNGSQALIGKCALIDKKTAGQTYGAFMCVYRSRYNKFIHYALLSDIFSYYLGTFLTSTVNQLTNQNLYNIRIPIPLNLKEQADIVAYLDKKCAKIDELIAEKQKATEIMRKYKKSLIYEYVTGKKRVTR